MKNTNKSDRFQDLLFHMNRIKHCIKKNTTVISVANMMNETITFQAKDNTQIQIKLYK
jgi:hypothetical protein